MPRPITTAPAKAGANATDANDGAAETSPPDRTLDTLNFFLADVRDGLGPYPAIYLVAGRGRANGWNEAMVGAVPTLAGIVGLPSQTPAGGLIDRGRNEPRIVMIAALLVTLCSIAPPIVTGCSCRDPVDRSDRRPRPAALRPGDARDEGEVAIAVRHPLYAADRASSRNRRRRSCNGIGRPKR